MTTYQKRGLIVGVAVLLVLVILGIVIFGSGGNSDPGNNPPDDGWEDIDITNKKIDINFLHIWPEHAKSFEQIVANFEKNNPNINVNIQSSTYSSIDSSLQGAYNGGKVPDVFFYWTHGVSQWVNQDLKLAEDITDIYYNVHKNEFISDGDCFISGQLNNRYYNVPFRATGFVIYYNKTLFEEYGWEKPNTLEEFEALLQQITEDSDLTPLHLWGVAGTFLYARTSLIAYADVISGRASDPNYRTGRLTQDDAYLDLLAEIYEKVRDWGGIKKYFGGSPLGSSTEGAEQALLNGECAMAMLNNNSLGVLQAESEDEFGVFSFPAPAMMNDPSAGYVHGGYYGFCLSALSSPEKKAAALKFLEYLCGDEAMQLFANNEGSIMARKSVTYTDPLQQDVAKSMRRAGVMGTFPQYKGSEATGGIGQSISSYCSGNSGSLERARELALNEYNSTVLDVTDTIMNPEKFQMIEPTYTVNQEELDKFIAWLRTR
ncbi:MAG: carbohydrate ABC transporter substrate-binding protein [Clostridia bacterium]|nr:carbohydrate ABC transporter substrate-binding protein [Clostridia bacterium]